MRTDVIYNGDCIQGLKRLPDNSIDLVVTSPPYNQNLSTQDTSKKPYKDNMDDKEYVNFIKELFREIFRVLKDDGSFFYNYKSDTKNNLINSAHFHLFNVIQDFKMAGEIIWNYAGNFDSNRTRFPIDYEMIFHLVKQNKFKFSDRNRKLTSVWNINHVMYGTHEKSTCENHPCPYPLKLIRKIVEHTTNENDIVLDPFMGSGTTAKACYELNRRFIGFELDTEYCEIALKRLKQKVIKGFFGTQANSTSSSFNKDLTENSEEFPQILHLAELR